MSQEVVLLIKSHLAGRRGLGVAKTPAQALLELAGSWVDERPPETIVEELREARRNSRRVMEQW